MIDYNLLTNINGGIIKLMSYQIRPISREELTIPIEWAAQEGWNPGLHDLESFYATDPSGFFMGFLDDKPISSLSAVAYDESFGFLGFYIVKPEHRGKGYGYQLWKTALNHLPTQNIGLDGVLAQQENYKKSGFKLAYRNIRFEGKGKKKGATQTQDNHIQLLSQVPFDQLGKYDNQIFPVNRSQFLKLWIQQPESLAIGFVENDQMRGYGMVRKCKSGYKVGPLFADNKDIALQLFERMREFVGEKESIFLDVPETNSEAVTLAKQFNMNQMFETARMYTKEVPKLPLHKIFGVTTFELG